MVIAGIGEKKSNKGTQFYQQNRIYNDNISMSCTATFLPYYAVTEREDKEMVNKAVRTYTPKECFRLMGFDDEDYEAAAKVNSDTQLFKQAGNSIVVDVLCEIFKEML